VLLAYRDNCLVSLTVLEAEEGTSLFREASAPSGQGIDVDDS
jgi:hypothetical protein